MKRILFSVVAILCSAVIFAANLPQDVKSPDGRLAINVSKAEGALVYSVTSDGKTLVADSPISVKLADGRTWDGSTKLVKAVKRTVNTTANAFGYRKAVVPDNFNELTLTFKEYSLVLRAYNDGVAWRFVSNLKTPYIVEKENVSFVFPEDWSSAVPYVNQHTQTLESQFYNSFENRYDYVPVSQWRADRLAFLPAMVEGPDGVKMCITESDVTVYPGMFLYNGDGDTRLDGIHAPYPKVMEQGDHINCQMIVRERENYIAKMDPTSRFPWRIICISHEDKDMANNDLPWLLGEPADPSMDFSWIKLGKVAWDWWNDWNITNVDFKSGVNDATYKYYIDFASVFGIEYILLDEGWAVSGKADLFDVIPEIHLEELVKYGEERGVGVILWAGYWAFARDLEKVCKHYSEMGIKGFKVDFMDRDDQVMEQFYYDAAAMTAKYHLMVDFHGAHKPVGLQRTFPNVVGYEGVYGLENMKWDADPDNEQVIYDVTIPYIRQLAGPMDYTQGAMRNASRGSYRPNNSEGMSQGTRCRQLAEFVVFESPFNMLCDSPSLYIKDTKCTQFIAQIPTCWDETVMIDGAIGKYIVTARRKGDTWYVGGMTDWDERDMEIDLSFLGEGDYNVELFRDGINADRAGCDYKQDVGKLAPSRVVKVHMAPGGGFAMKLTK